MLGQKRTASHLDAVESESCFPFFSPRDKELYDMERDVLARVVYKQHCAFRRIDILDRIKAVVRLMDKLSSSPSEMFHKSELLLVAVHRASERFFQQLTMGLMIPMSSVCLGSLARVSEIIQRIPKNISSVTNIAGIDDDDCGEPLDR